MVRWRTQRLWLWRTNALLVPTLVLAWWAAFTPHVPVAEPVFDPMPEVAGADEQTGPWISWADLREAMRGCCALPLTPEFELPGRLAAIPAQIEPTELPLAAFEIRVWIHLPGEPDVILLAPKDPSRAERHVLREGETKGAFAFTRLETEGTSGRFHIRRGEDAFCYRYARATDWSAPGLRRVRWEAHGPHVASARQARPGEGLSVDAALSRDVKAVPFYGDQGELVGARVTGVRPGTWAERQGLARGDVIIALNEGVFASPDEVVTKLAAISRPGRIDVLRRSGNTIERVMLGDG